MTNMCKKKKKKNLLFEIEVLLPKLENSSYICVTF